MKPSHKSKVLAHLKEHKTITSWEAIDMFRCTRLADSNICFKRRRS
jgi:hypothetical protein